MNEINTDPAGIMVENNVDLEGPPENFKYINDYMPGDGLTIPQDPIIGCECENCLDVSLSIYYIEFNSVNVKIVLCYTTCQTRIFLKKIFQFSY